MALRKLNASYAKRTGELREAREQVDHLRAELEEAWKVAEDMAQEMDDLDNFQTGFSSESEPEEDEDDTRMDESVRLAEVIGVTGKAVAMKATLTQLVADRAKERERNDYENHSQRVSAARKRSSRTSKASLRLPKTSKGSAPSSPTPAADHSSISSRRSRSRSKSRRRRSAEESVPSSFKPPVPALQVDTVSVKKSPKDDSFLEMAETRPVSPASPLAAVTAPPLPTNMNAVLGSLSPSTSIPHTEITCTGSSGYRPTRRRLTRRQTCHIRLRDPTHNHLRARRRSRRQFNWQIRTSSPVIPTPHTRTVTKPRQQRPQTRLE